MKKFFFRLCTSAVKSMHTAVCIVLFSVSVLAQNSFLANKLDSMPFHKWEVSLDVKPLFRSDAPYNLMAKWHFSEHGALRLGLGNANVLIQKDTFRIYEYYLDANAQQNIVQYEQYQYGPNDSKYINWEIKIGYQYEFLHGKVGLFTSTDLDYKIERTTFNVPVQSSSVLTGVANPFPGYQSVISFYDKRSTYSLIQSFGLQYFLNNYFSLTIESSISVRYIEFLFGKSEYPSSPTPNGIYVKSTTKGGNETDFTFSPIMGLFINYHF